MKDLRFVRRCVHAESGAWDELVNKYSRLIYAYIHRVLNSKGISVTAQDARDIFQELLAALLEDKRRRLKKFKGKNKCSFATWLRQVTVNFTIDYTRRLKFHSSLEDEPEEAFECVGARADFGFAQRNSIDDAEAMSALKDCIGRLDRNEKYFLELHIHRGLTLDKLKDHFRISRGAIDMRKAKLVNRLKECLRKKGYGK